MQHSGWLARRVLWMAWLLPWLAQLHAARGELDLAEKWLDAARVTLPAEKHEHARARQSVSWRCVAARNDEAVAAIDAYIRRRTRRDPVRQHFAFLRAFALHRAGRPLPDAEVRDLVKLRLASPGRALPIEKWWVDFATYVDEYAA